MLLNADGKPTSSTAPGPGQIMVAAITLAGQCLFAMEEGDLWHFPVLLMPGPDHRPMMMPFMQVFAKLNAIPRPFAQQCLYVSREGISPFFVSLYKQHVNEERLRMAGLTSAQSL